MLDLPRSVRFAAWTSALVRGDVPLEDALTAIQGTDEPHAVSGADDASTALSNALRWLAGVAGQVGVALPVPGNLLGLPGPPEFNAAALEAGESVLVELDDGARDVKPPAWAALGTSTLGLVPDTTEFGSWLEPGCLVTWRAHPTHRRRVVDLASLSEAERALREAMLTATEALGALDVARWREDAAERIAAVRNGGLDRRVVPASTAPRALRVLASAARVRAIVSLACQDDGAAITSWQASSRTAALRDVDHVARRAMVAAVNLPG
ncbi:MAG: hypothetical protein ACLGIA_00425 [Actinomycetes bacterium]